MAFIDQGEFEAMKMLISRRSQHCDKDRFRAKITVNRSQDFVEKLKAERRRRKMALP